MVYRISLILVFLTLVFSGCPTEGVDSYTVSGTITISPPTSSGAEIIDIAIGETAAMLAAAGGDPSGLVGLTSIPVPNGSTAVNFEFQDVPEGTYQIAAGIDVDGNGDMTDFGDYRGSYNDLDPTADPPEFVVTGDRTDGNFTVNEN